MAHASSGQSLRIYLIRHAEAEGSTSGRLLGFTDPPLSSEGHEQALWLAQELAGAHLSAVYSSDLLRAKSTAEGIAERHSLVVRPREELREINMGDWEGRTLAAIHTETPEQIEQLYTDPASFCYPAGESFTSFAARVLGALDQLMIAHESGAIAVVAHGGVCRAIIGNALGMPMHNWLRLAQNNGCLNVIDWYESGPILRLLNRTFENVVTRS